MDRTVMEEMRKVMKETSPGDGRNADQKAAPMVGKKAARLADNGIELEADHGSGKGTEPKAIGLEHDPVAMRQILNRLKRAHGQLGGTINLIENGGNCRAVVQQMAAISKALDRAGFLVIATAMRECITAEGEDFAENQHDLEKMFLSLA